jgi:hypothetical protein
MTDTLERTPTPTPLRRFTITGIEGETPDAGAHRVRSEYVEDAWMSYLGPVTITIARRFDLILSTEHKYGIDVPKWADQLCITGDDLMAACHRLVRWGLAHWSDRDPMLSMARYWPQVPAAIRTPRHRQVLIGLPDTEAQ